MKRLSIILAAFAAFACSESDTSEDLKRDAVIEISASSIEFGADGTVQEGKNIVTVKSSDRWELVSKTVTWCTTSITSGENGTAVTFEIAENNDSGETREVEYAFVCGNKCAKLLVTQHSFGFIEPISYSYYMGHKGGEIIVPVKHDVNFSYEISDEAKDWITDVTTRATEIKYLRFNVATTAKYDVRKGYILLKKPGSTTPVKVEIQQDFLRDIQIEQLNYTVEPEGGVIKVDVMANTEFDVDIPETAAKWISQIKKPASGLESRAAMVGNEIYLKIEPTNSSRTGVVSYSIPTKTIQVSIKQKGVNSKPLNEDDVNFAKKLESAGLVTLVDGKYELTEAGIAAQVIDVSNANIVSLKGIEQFENLVRFNCSSNKISSLEDVLRCEKIDYLNCANNDITSLDVSKLKVLKSILCVSNPSTIINLGDNAIEQLTFSNPFQNGSSGPKATTCKVISSKLSAVFITSQGTDLDVLDLRECTALTTVSAYIWNNPARKIIISKSQEGKVYVSYNEYYTTIEYQ